MWLHEPNPPFNHARLAEKHAEQRGVDVISTMARVNSAFQPQPGPSKKEITKKDSGSTEVKAAAGT